MRGVALPHARWLRVMRCILCFAIAIHLCVAQDLYSLIPDPTDFYSTQGMPYFGPTQLRFSQTVYLYSRPAKSYWTPIYDSSTEDWRMLGNGHRPLTHSHEFELIDAGTMNNLPLNTRPRKPDLFDQGTQHFPLRFNESFVLRSESINKYVATRGVNWQSDVYFTNNMELAERFTILPVRTQLKPTFMPIADNNNIDVKDNYVQNGTDCHLLNQQFNYMNKIPDIDYIVNQGPGTRKKGLWRDGDVFQLHLKKPFEG